MMEEEEGEGGGEPRGAIDSYIPVLIIGTGFRTVSGDQSSKGPEKHGTRTFRKTCIRLFDTIPSSQHKRKRTSSQTSGSGRTAMVPGRGN